DGASTLCISSVVFFFFQAEDGIRDWSVTGVQTCALPIYLDPTYGVGSFLGKHLDAQGHGRAGRVLVPEREGQDRIGVNRDGGRRSEERRVGKEGRSRWWPDH